MKPELDQNKAPESGSIASQFARYVSLNVVGMVGISCYILADTYFIANGVGTNGLAALNFAIVIYAILQAIGLMLGIGGATRFQVLKALGRTEEASKIFMNALYLGLAAAVILMIAVLGFATPIARFLGADSDTVGLTDVYLVTIFSFAPLFLLNNILLAFTRNDGSPQLAMIAMVSGSLLNIFLDYLFIIEFGWGMFGAAFATGIGPIVSIAILSIHSIRRKNTFHLVKVRPQIKLMARIVALGFSSFIVEFSGGAVVLFVFNLIILHFEGNTGVAAYGIVANIAFVATALFVGIAQGIQPLSSRSYAHRNASDLRKVLRYALSTALVLATLLYIVIAVGAEPLAHAFNRDGDPHLTALAVEGLRIYFLGYFFASVNIIAAAFFSSVEQPGRGLLISILRGFVAVLGLVAVLASIYGMTGVWASFPLAELFTFVVTFVFLIGFLRKIRSYHVR